MSAGEIASAALELHAALVALIADVHGYDPEACTGSTSLAEAEAIVAKYNDGLSWVAAQGA